MAKELVNKFKKSLPETYRAAIESISEEQFINYVLNFSSQKIQENLSPESVRCAETLLAIAENETSSIYELSRGERIYLETLTLLWNFLRGSWDKSSGTDLYKDLLNLFLIAEGINRVENPSPFKIAQWMKRWPSGLDREVREKQEQNRERLIKIIIEKIEKRGSSSSRYSFPQNISYETKYSLVIKWWDDFRFHLSMAARTPAELNQYLEESLPVRVMKNLNKAKNKGIPFFVTPYYLSLLNIDEYGYDDNTIRSYIIYSEMLVETYGNIKAWEKEDIVEYGKPNAAGWLLPDSNSIHRRYPEVAIVIPETRGRSCGGLCALCQRMYDFQSERLNFELDQLKPKEHWEKRLNKLMLYFKNDSQLRDILVTGGDALMTSNKNLVKVLDAILKMAEDKINDNLEREDTNKYAQLQRVRLGSRLLAYLPFRVDDALISILSDFKVKGERVGISQFVIQTHFESPLEVTPQAALAIKKLLSAGWVITNQLVFSASASRRGHTAKLRQTLNNLGVITYYTFTVKGFNENRALFAPNSRSLQEAAEEKVAGKLTPQQIAELNAIFTANSNIAKEVKHFLKHNELPFLPTDRNVLNLPAIGKSMTFKTIGITKSGERILKFDHDQTRIHSPIIDKMGNVYIAENRSITSYIKELESLGEKKRDYLSIWSYTQGETEPLFPLFDYPESEIKFTDKMTNLTLE